MEAQIITNKVIECKYCKAKCFWVKSKVGKWYLSTASYDTNLNPIPWKVKGRNGKFYQIHQCQEAQHRLQSKMDMIIHTDDDFKVVSADMPQLVTCQICGRTTRVEWKCKEGTLWACSFHNSDEVWNKIVTRNCERLNKKEVTE